jgi:hypothetical protein
MGRPVAELPGEKRPEKETEVIEVDRWVLAVYPLLLRLGRQRAVTSLGFLSIVLFPRAKATDRWSISHLDPMKDNTRFATCRLIDQKIQAILADSVA